MHKSAILFVWAFLVGERWSKKEYKNLIAYRCLEIWVTKQDAIDAKHKSNKSLKK